VPAKFRSKGVGAIEGKWPAADPESELRSFENLALEQEPEPLKFSGSTSPGLHNVERKGKSSCNCTKGKQLN